MHVGWTAAGAQLQLLASFLLAVAKTGVALVKAAAPWGRVSFGF